MERKIELMLSAAEWRGLATLGPIDRALEGAMRHYCTLPKFKDGFPLVDPVGSMDHYSDRDCIGARTWAVPEDLPFPPWEDCSSHTRAAVRLYLRALGREQIEPVRPPVQRKVCAPLKCVLNADLVRRAQANGSLENAIIGAINVGPKISLADVPQLPSTTITWRPADESILDKIPHSVRNDGRELSQWLNRALFNYLTDGGRK